MASITHSLRQATVHAVAITLLASIMSSVAITAQADAAVPGKPFTETGCEEYSDSVARLYTAGLGRQPEQGGFEWWLTEYSAGRWSLTAAAEFFTQSTEFQVSYGALDDRGFVQQLYRNVLGREGEVGGVDFWTDELTRGSSRGTVLLRFAESPENIVNSGTTQPALGEFNNGLAGAWTCAVAGPTTAPAEPTVNQQRRQLPAPIGWATEALAAATIRAQSNQPPYDRDAYSGSWGWSDTDGDCQNDRHEVLIAESLVRVTLSADGCFVESGRWVDPYTGQAHTSASAVTIDHTVPLAHAHRSGASTWGGSRKQAFHSDLAEPATLVVVGAATNQSKGDRGPDRWRPTLRSSWCGYAVAWVRVKQRWSLSYTAAEVAALEEMLGTCTADSTVPGYAQVEIARSVVAPRPAPRPATPQPAPAPTPPPTGPSGGVELASCNRHTEVVTIRNSSGSRVSLSGWWLHDKGNKHRYHFNQSLAPGESLDVLTGRDAAARAGAVVWKRNHVWNNEGDTAHLVAPDGTTTTRRC